MSSPAPRRLRLGLVGIVLVVLLLGACTGRPSTPTAYGKTTKTNFSRGCENTARAQGLSDPENYCDCVYKEIVEQIPYDEFKKINSDLSDDPGPLPAKMQKVLDACDDAA